MADPSYYNPNNAYVVCVKRAKQRGCIVIAYEVNAPDAKVLAKFTVRRYGAREALSLANSYRDDYNAKID